MQNHKSNEVENAFPIFKLSKGAHGSHHSSRNKMIFAVFYV